MRTKKRVVKKKVSDKRVRGGASHPCPKCDSPTQVRTTRLKEEGVLRNRECGSCGEIFDTLEIVPPVEKKKRAA